MACLNALEIKPLGFLTHTVKAVWILDNSFPEDSIDRDQATRLVSRPLSLLVAVLVVQERQRPRRPAARFDKKFRIARSV